MNPDDVDAPAGEQEPVAKEMFDAVYEHVDAVKGPAHGMRFVVLKAQLTEQDRESVMKVKNSTAAIPENPTANGSLKEEPVKKADDQTAAVDPEPVAKADTTLDAGEVLADAGKGAPEGDATEPGSPAWEAVDAATARKWTAILSRSKNALAVMADRENVEAATGADGDAMENAFNLADATCAIDYAIGILAPFAADEQTSVDTQVDAVAKAMVNASTDDLDVIESLGPVRKAGRVLSASNEAAIRGAVDSLQKVLSSLPAAPEDVTKSKEATPVEPAELETKVTKAKGDPMVPVYDANGNLCGMVQADDIVPIAAAPAAATDKEPTPAPPEATADGNLVPGAAPDAAAAGVPTATAQGQAAQQSVAKSQTPDDIAELIKTEVAKALKAVDEDHQSVVKSLEDRLAVVEKQPRPGGPKLGPIPLGGLQQVDGGHLVLRGEGAHEESAEVVRIRKALDDTKDPIRRENLQRELATLQMRERLTGQ